MEVIDDDDAGERAPGQRPAWGKGAGAGFQVGLDDLHGGFPRCLPGQAGQGARLPVHRHHRVASFEKIAPMAPAARRQVQNRAARRSFLRHQGREAAHPGRGLGHAEVAAAGFPVFGVLHLLNVLSYA